MSRLNSNINFFTQHGVFNWPIDYDSYEIVDDKNNYIRIYNNVILGDASSEQIFCYNGTNLIITCTPHYFHYLKEYYASFLYYKRNYENSAKYLHVNNAGYIYPKHQKMCEVCKWTESFIIQDKNGEFDISVLSSACLLIERLVIVFDGQQVIAKFNPEFTDWTNTPGLNWELRKMFLKKQKRSKNKKQKIFLSRRVVSEELKNWNHPGLKDSEWLDTQRRLRYHPDWVEEEIEQVFLEHGYEIIQPSGIPMDEQIEIFANATHVAGLLGTGFYNGIFCKRGTKFTALRINPDYWYDFEGDIRSVIDCEFKYIHMADHLASKETIRKHLIESMIES